MDIDWKIELLCSSLARWKKSRSRMCPAYVGKSRLRRSQDKIHPMAARDGQVGYDQLHHFIASGAWNGVPLEKVLLAEADKIVGRWSRLADHRRHGAAEGGGVGRRGAAIRFFAGKTANCRLCVSATLASREVR